MNPPQDYQVRPSNPPGKFERQSLEESLKDCYLNSISRGPRSTIATLIPWRVLRSDMGKTNNGPL